jgi:RNA polymerase-binding transcription factor DksA
MLPVPDLARQLRVRRRALFAQVAGSAAVLRALADNGEPDVVDEGSEQNLGRLLAALDDASQAEIAAIDRALARIASGAYGRCVGCGEPIDAARLAAVPAADACLPCTKARERPRA